MKNKNKEFYVSVDIESDGPIPGEYSMLSFGASAFDEKGVMLGTFFANLTTLVGAKQHPDTMAWWDQNRSAWEKHRKDTIDPDKAMDRFRSWLKSLGHHGFPVCVAYPAGFDWTFLYWYLMKFGGSSPFSFSCLDIKTLAMTVLGDSYRGSTKRNMPKHWFPKNAPHTHVAVDDAIEQGMLFSNIMKDLREQQLRSKLFEDLTSDDLSGRTFLDMLLAISHSIGEGPLKDCLDEKIDILRNTTT